MNNICEYLENGNFCKLRDKLFQNRRVDLKWCKLCPKRTTNKSKGKPYNFDLNKKGVSNEYI